MSQCHNTPDGLVMIVAVVAVVVVVDVPAAGDCGACADAVLGISPAVGRVFSKLTMHWAALFYHMHRIAHLPGVYDQAHKAHHYLHDATAFDAHLYGSGAPEVLSTMHTYWGFLIIMKRPALMSRSAKWRATEGCFLSSSRREWLPTSLGVAPQRCAEASSHRDDVSPYIP